MGRSEKLQMIKTRNPLFADLSHELFDLFGSDFDRIPSAAADELFQACLKTSERLR